MGALSGRHAPSATVVAETQDGQPSQVECAGPGVGVGADPSASSHSGVAPAPGPAGEVRDLAFDLGPVLSITRLPCGRGLLCSGHLEQALVPADGDGALDLIRFDGRIAWVDYAA